MPRVEKISLSEKLKEQIDSIKNSLPSASQAKIPDIITFCESPNFLGLKKYNDDGDVVSNLRLMQRIILKVFYRGSIGNEDLKLTEEELQICVDLGLNNKDKGNLLEKYYTDEIFRELVLVWGRRSGKTFLFSVIALYEAMKLLEVPGGDPYALYKLGRGSEISILTVATSADQAKLAFTETREKLINSPYFSDKFRPEGIGIDSMYLLTPQDKKDNISLRKKGVSPSKGSICIEVGHSNSSALRGKQIFVLLFDEIAQYVQTSGTSSDERLYSSLEPSVNTFFRIVEVCGKYGNPIFDEKGKRVVKKIFDGKIISISSPLGSEGKLYQLFTQAPNKSLRLACRLPTWQVNESLTEEDLRNNSDLSEDQFRQEYGAEFSGAGGTSFFQRECIEKIFHNSQIRGAKFVNMGSPGTVYFAHLDPASISHNYALVITHKELYLNKETKSVDFYVVVDHIKYWSPLKGKPIRVEEVDEYMIGLKNRFFFGLVTYDQWHSASSIEKLKKAGIPAKCTHFNRRYMMKIYDELYQLVVGEKIIIPKHDLLKKEMIGLQRKLTQSNGYKVMPSSTGPVQSDDLIDSLAGACYNTIASQFESLPKGKIINVGAIGSTDNHRMWQSMSGPLGYGTGQQVTQRLENIKSWPGHKRR